jgi:hypothetical protein
MVRSLALSKVDLRSCLGICISAEEYTGFQEGELTQ